MQCAFGAIQPELLAGTATQPCVSNQAALQNESLLDASWEICAMNLNQLHRVCTQKAPAAPSLLLFALSTQMSTLRLTAPCPSSSVHIFQVLIASGLADLQTCNEL